jgi:uncharacterized metal-binding protein
MSMPKPKAVIIPCSGIGKSMGSVSREAAYLITQEERPCETSLMALSKLVLGDEESRQILSRLPAITIDGCKLACASKVVVENGGTIAAGFDVLETYRHHREFKPEGISVLNEGGEKLAAALCQEICDVIDNLPSPGDDHA